MKDLKKSLSALKKSKNGFGWMLAVATVHEAYSDSLKERKEKLFLLGNRASSKNNRSEKLDLIGETLVQKQQETVSKLAKLVGKQKNMAQLFLKYEQLKKERENLLNQLAAEKHDYKDRLANEINKFR